MNGKRSSRSKTIAVALMVIAIVCIVFSQFVTLGTIQHILLSVTIVVLGGLAYFIGRTPKSDDV